MLNKEIHSLTGTLQYLRSKSVHEKDESVKTSYEKQVTEGEERLRNLQAQLKECRVQQEQLPKLKYTAFPATPVVHNFPLLATGPPGDGGAIPRIYKPLASADLLIIKR